MKKQSKRSFAILLVLLFLVMLIKPLNLKVKAEDYSNVPAYQDYTKGYIGFALQWKNKSFLVVQDNTRKDTGGEYPDNLKFIMVENGKEKIITTDNKYMPKSFGFNKVYNDELYFFTYGEHKEGQNWADVKKYIYKYNLETMQLSLVKEINEQSKQFPEDKYSIANGIKTLVDNSGNFKYVLDYREKNLPYYNTNEYIVLKDGEKETNVLFSTAAERPEFFKDYFIDDYISDYKGNTWFTCTVNYSIVSPDSAETTEEKRVEYARRNDLLKTLMNNGTLHNDRLIYKIDKNQNVTKIDITPLTTVRGGISFWEIDKDDNIWIDGTSYNESKGDWDRFIAKARVGADNTLKILEKIPLENYGPGKPTAIDANGTIWALDNGKLKKYENGKMVTKYLVYDKFHNDSIVVYDDNNFIVYGDAGYKVVSANVPEASMPNTPVPSTEQPKVSEKITTLIDNTTKTAIVTYDPKQLSKNGINEIIPTLSKDVQNVEAKIDAEAVNGGTGSIKMKANDVNMELPFSAVDYEGTAQGSYVSVKQNIIANDTMLNAIKSIGKVFDFSLATYKQDGTKIKDIHSFKNGKAKISIKLINDDIKNLDTTKLSAFYYNEETKMWEAVGGSFDKASMAFTFETPHFSKYTIAQINGTLPQTGAALNNSDLIIIGFLLVVSGGLFLIRKAKVRQILK